MGFVSSSSILLCLVPLVQSLGGAGSPQSPMQSPTRKPTAVPTLAVGPVDPDMYPVTFEEYANGARCGSEEFVRQNCYQDSEGNYFRYGCKAKDGLKVYTDTCGKDGCGYCQNNWKWYSEEANMCIIDEPNSKFFKFTCHAPGEIKAVEVAVPEEKPAASKTCAELRWPVVGGSTSVCAASLVLNGRCSGEVDFFTARRTCAKVGGRLCTAGELDADETKGTGCKADCKRVWSGSECTTPDGTVGFYSLAGARKCKASVPAQCQDPSAQTGVVRCCADVASEGASSIVETKASEFPAGFSKAVSSDYAGSSCGDSTPLRQYSCWVNPVDNTAQRFACRQGMSSVWAQSCGQDDTCTTCSGDWFTQNEFTGQCYSTGTTLYSYTCE